MKSSAGIFGEIRQEHVQICGGAGPAWVSGGAPGCGRERHGHGSSPPRGLCPCSWANCTALSVISGACASRIRAFSQLLACPALPCVGVRRRCAPVFCASQVQSARELPSGAAPRPRMAVIPRMRSENNLFIFRCLLHVSFYYFCTAEPPDFGRLLVQIIEKRETRNRKSIVSF